MTTFQVHGLKGLKVLYLRTVQQNVLLPNRLFNLEKEGSPQPKHMEAL